MSGAVPPVPRPPRRPPTFPALERRPFAITRTAPAPSVRRVDRPVVAVQRTELDGSGRMDGNAVFVTPDTLLTDCRFAMSAKSPKLLPWLRVRIGETELAATVTGYSHAWRLVALTARGLRGEPAPRRVSRLLRPGEPVSVVAAMGDDLRVVDGEIVGLGLAKERYPYERHYEIETSLPAWPGSEGAGLFDTNGNLVGMCAERTPDGRIVAWPADRFAVAGGKYAVRGLLGQGLFRDAARTLRPMLGEAAGADDPELWCMLAVCAEGLGRAEERRHALRQAAGLDEQNAWAAHALGTALLSPPAERGQALACLRRAVRLEPWNEHYRRSLEDAQR